MSENALSKITGNDYEFSIENLSKPQSFCKDKEVLENNSFLTKTKVASQKQINKSSSVFVAPKLKTITVEIPLMSNEIYLLTINQVLNKDFNSLGLRKIN
jgi:hypothetical protein